MITCLWTWGLFSNTKSVSMIVILANALLYFILARILESYVLFWSPRCRRYGLARDGLQNNKMIKMIDSFICREKWKKSGSFCLWKGRQFLPSKRVFFFLPPFRGIWLDPAKGEVKCVSLHYVGPGIRWLQGKLTLKEDLIKSVMGMEKEKVVPANCGEEMVGCMV